MTLTFSLSNFLSVRDWFQAHLQIRKEWGGSKQPRIVPDKESGLSEVRFWHEDEFLSTQKAKNSDLNLVYFNF